MDVQSHDSVPPAPGCRLSIAFELSYSPESNVSTLCFSYEFINSSVSSFTSCITLSSLASMPSSQSVMASSNWVSSFSKAVSLFFESFNSFSIPSVCPFDQKSGSWVFDSSSSTFCLILGRSK